MYYRKDIFHRYNITPPATWEGELIVFPFIYLCNDFLYVRFSRHRKAFEWDIIQPVQSWSITLQSVLAGGPSMSLLLRTGFNAVSLCKHAG